VGEPLNLLDKYMQKKNSFFVSTGHLYCMAICLLCYGVNCGSTLSFLVQWSFPYMDVMQFIQCLCSDSNFHKSCATLKFACVACCLLLSLEYKQGSCSNQSVFTYSSIAPNCSLTTTPRTLVKLWPGNLFLGINLMKVMEAISWQLGGLLSYLAPMNENWLNRRM
jgi:hypothetical protein